MGRSVTRLLARSRARRASARCWTTRTVPGRRPVMVYMHGGGFAAGFDSDLLSYDGENLARDAQTLGRTHLARCRLVWARRDVAVRALEIATAREIPRDHMWHVVARRLELRRLGPSEVYRGCPMWSAPLSRRSARDI